MRQVTNKTGLSRLTIRAILNSFRWLTVAEVCKKLGLSRYQLDLRIRRGIFPNPTYVRKSGVSFFDEEWVKRAQAIQKSSKIVQESTRPIELRVVGVTEKEGKQALVCKLDYDGDEEMLPEWLRQKIRETRIATHSQ